MNIFHQNGVNVAPTFKVFTLSCISIPFQSNLTLGETLTIKIYRCMKLRGALILIGTEQPKNMLFCWSKYEYLYYFLMLKKETTKKLPKHIKVLQINSGFLFHRLN